ncbi:MAG: bifunctional phosphopantothenoylcysteine decarboxylase/phosphopantothenate--cysteine ligase CoaBC [Eggerthellaceae bacterium]|nr:bifunctional phosphopantothenoylcysteine decarboxylase/phosphopantothenate--cysteine ligase CoaBC [Eggerthellaceae bacterium]
MSNTILIGVTGCIAAYKSAELVRVFQKAGYRVKVVMTEHATHFVDPLTFRSLTHEPVAVGLFDDPSDPIHHISLADEADAFIIAPCTANVVAKIAHGIADDLLTTTALACTSPIVVAPAMNVHMYEAAITQENLSRLARRGVRIVEAASGYLACGDVGRGRLAEINDIVSAAVAALENNDGVSSRDLAGKRVLVTAGPTYEPIDPVRFVGNRSSGKMGFAIAEAAAERGADVVLISGPVRLADPASVETVHVTTALEMLDACEEHFPLSDIAVFAAAVADYRPEITAERKLKKANKEDVQALENLRLVPNPDILALMAARKRKDQVVVGFAAETECVQERAMKKLSSKHADMIVGNLVGGEKAFGRDDNQAILVSNRGVDRLPLMTKIALADVILDNVLDL